MRNGPKATIVVSVAGLLVFSLWALSRKAEAAPPEPPPPEPPPPEPPPPEPPPPEPPPPELLPEFSLSVRKSRYPTIEPYTVCETWFDVKNNGDGPGVYVLHVWDNVGVRNNYITVTLNPGKIYTFHTFQWIDFSRIATYRIEAQGDWVGNNYSVATFLRG